MLPPSLLVILPLQARSFSLHGRVALSWISHCARPTRAFSGRALREHRRSTDCPPSPSKLARFSPRRVAWSILDYAQLSHPPTRWYAETCHYPRRGFSSPRYLSSREWPRLPFTARIERAHSYCARSASKKGTWPLPSYPSERARSASRRTTRLPSSYTHSGAYSFPASFSANHRYRAGKTTNVSAVDVKRPPMTTVASGRCTSAPIPCASTNGSRPSSVVIIVMTTGRSRRTQPLTIAWSICVPSLRN